MAEGGESEGERPRGGVVFSDVRFELINSAAAMDDVWSPWDSFQGPQGFQAFEPLSSFGSSQYIEPFLLDLDAGPTARDDDSSSAAAQPAVVVVEARSVHRPSHVTTARDQDLQNGPSLIPHAGSPTTGIGASTLPSNGGSSISRGAPEFRMRRLIESTNRRRVLRSRSSGHSEADSLRNNILQSQISLEASRKMRPDGSDGQREEKSDDASNFECNICLELAKGPVVTPCGHLFCWQCLYRWLHVNSICSECPVCKGEVLEVNVTPIYGRGRTDDNKCEDGESGIKIPPRPQAKRVESARLQQHAALLQVRHAILNEEATNGDRTISRRGSGSNPRRRTNAIPTSNVVRLRSQRTQRDEGSGSSPVPVLMPTEDTSDHQLPEHHNNTTSPENVVAGGGNRHALPPMSTTGPVAEPSHRTSHRIESSFAANHSSDSSTMAVIHGDPVSTSELQSTLTDASTGPIRRPSTTSRRRGRNTVTDSVQDDGGPNQSRRRRA